jgi:adenine-specific DNA-methyltransferase
MGHIGKLVCETKVSAGAGFCDFVASFYKTKPIPVVSTNKLQLPEKELRARISELELEIKKLKDKKYGLVWEDKPEDVVLQCNDNVPILREVKTRKLVLDKSLPANILIEGDNYHSLSVLNYTHNSAIDLIYIDPPYNTGAQDWKYNNDYVDNNDPWRHSKWVSWMSKRLHLSKRLLKRDGVLIVAIDDYEVNSLGLLLEELFPNHDRSLIIVEHHPQGAGSNTISRTHEYAYICVPEGVGITGRTITDMDDNWSLKRSGQGENNWRQFRPKQFFAVLIDEKSRKVVGVGPELKRDEKYPLGKSKEGYLMIYPLDKDGGERAWRYNRQTMQSLISKDQIEYSKNGALSVRKVGEKQAPIFSVWKDTRYNAGVGGSNLLNEILGGSNKFPYPKSLFTVMDMVNMIVKFKHEAVILDFFAGSGTTGHAVLELNKQDGGNRRFILSTNNENKICEEVTYERIKRVMKGYKNKKGEDVEGLGGNLSYYKTDLVNIDKLQRISDEAKIKVSHQAGEMIALREDTLAEIERTDWWQIFEGNHKLTAIYFKEDKAKLPELIKLLEKKNVPAVLYVFGWGKNEYKNEYSTDNIRVEDIPEPIIEVYQEINRL